MGNKQIKGAGILHLKVESWTEHRGGITEYRCSYAGCPLHDKGLGSRRAVRVHFMREHHSHKYYVGGSLDPRKFYVGGKLKADMLGEK